MTKPIYAIGDLHGQSAEFDRLLSLIDRDGGPEAQVVFLGDYTDRGPDSRGVLDRLIAGRAAGRDWITLKGNHDRMFAWFLEDFPRHDPHLFLTSDLFVDLTGFLVCFQVWLLRGAL